MAEAEKKKTDWFKVGYFDVFLIVNLYLKLTGLVAWSWWFVLWPVWVPLGIAAVLLVILFFMWATTPKVSPI
jgi:hypothetical protein